MAVGVAAKLSVGAGAGVGGVLVTLIATDLFTDPPAPWHESANVVLALSGPTTCVPAVALLPLQPWPAVQELTLVPFHVSVTLAPLVMLAELLVNVRAGVAGGGVVEPPPVLLPRGTIAQLA